jgi:hypothetical protein
MGGCDQWVGMSVIMGAINEYQERSIGGCVNEWVRSMSGCDQ